MIVSVLTPPTHKHNDINKGRKYWEVMDIFMPLMVVIVSQV